MHAYRESRRSNALHASSTHAACESERPGMRSSYGVMPAPDDDITDRIEHPPRQPLRCGIPLAECKHPGTVSHLAARPTEAVDHDATGCRRRGSEEERVPLQAGCASHGDEVGGQLAAAVVRDDSARPSAAPSRAERNHLYAAVVTAGCHREFIAEPDDGRGRNAMLPRDRAEVIGAPAEQGGQEHRC